MTNKTAIALAEAIESRCRSSPLQLFVLDCCDTNMDCEILYPLARAVMAGAFKRLELWCLGTTVWTEIKPAEALAEAIGSTPRLQAFQLYCEGPDGEGADTVLTQRVRGTISAASKRNTPLSKFSISCDAKRFIFKRFP